VNAAYEAWNQAFIDEYFPQGNSGKLAWLPVDDDEIRALAENYGLGDPAAAVDNFEAVVNAWLATKGGSFTKFTAGLSWRRVRDTPPYVAGLAFCVHAASRMAPDATAGIASHNYYAQLNRLIRRDDDAGRPPGFEVVGDAWQDLATWLDADCAGRRGLSTFRTNEHVGKYVGWPMSQALLRASDRRRLPDFFRSAGLEPESDVSPQRLFSLVRAWAMHPGCGLSQAARSAIAHAQDIGLDEIAETVLRELRAWDGELRDARGRLRASLHLLVIPRRRGTQVRLLARRPEGFPDGTWQLNGTDGEIHLHVHPTAEGWFAPLDRAVTAATLEHGLRLTRDGFALTFEAGDAIPCRQAVPEIGGYLSQPQATMFEPHLAVLRRHLVPRLKDYLSRYAEPPPGLRDAAQALPAAWAMTADFRFTSRPEAAPPEFGRLAPKLVATTSFSGGLRLSSTMYLTGGEPDVNIATEAGGALVPELDGVAQPLKGGALTLRLSAMGLPPGTHTLSADVTRRFATVDTFGEPNPADAGSLGFKLSRHGGYRPQSTFANLVGGSPPQGWLHVSGAVASGRQEDLPIPGRRPVLLRAGALRYVLIGRQGEVARPTSTHAPAWLQRLGLGGQFQFVEVSLDFDPVWLLRETPAFAKEVTALDPDAPRTAPGAGTVQAWSEAVVQWKNAAVRADLQDAWTAYVAVAAAALRERSP
jgi:hypothetical protein